MFRTRSAEDQGLQIAGPGRLRRLPRVEYSGGDQIRASPAGEICWSKGSPSASPLFHGTKSLGLSWPEHYPSLGHLPRLAPSLCPFNADPCNITSADKKRIPLRVAPMWDAPLPAPQPRGGRSCCRPHPAPRDCRKGVNTVTLGLGQGTRPARTGRQQSEPRALFPPQSSRRPLECF